MKSERGENADSIVVWPLHGRAKVMMVQLVWLAKSRIKAYSSAISS